MRVVLQAVGDQVVLGNAQPIDIFAFQEGPESAAEYNDVEANFEAVFGGNYQSTLATADFFGCRTGFVYNTDRVQLIAATTFSSGFTHNIRRGLFRPVDGTVDDQVYIYSIHLKAGASDESIRDDEATSIRLNAATLPTDAHIIYCGDFNIKGSDEPAYQTLFAPGSHSTAAETLNTPFGFFNDIEWQDNLAFLPFHTQNPVNNMDDRFDAIYVNNNLLDGSGLEYVRGSCTVLGNNGTHNMNQSINTGNGAAGFGSQLIAFSDHLPVFCDFVYGQTPTDFDATVNTAAVSTQFVRNNGPVGGATGDNAIEVEGSSNGNFAAFGVVDFDLSGLLASGASVTDLDNIVLSMVQDNSTFSDSGPISLYLATSAAANVTIDGGIQYQTGQNGLASVPEILAAGAVKVATYAAVHETNSGAPLPDGTADPIALYGGDIGQAVSAALKNKGVIRLLITPDHAGTAATYAGFSNGLGGPGLFADLVTDDGTVEVFPSSFTLNNGVQGSGNIFATNESNDNRINFLSDTPVSKSEPPIQITFTGTLGVGSVETLTATVETQSNTANVAQTIEMFNFTSGEWELIDSSDVDLVDQTIIAVPAGDISRFITVGNLVLTRVSWKPSGPVLMYPWRTSIDHFKWSISIQ